MVGTGRFVVLGLALALGACSSAGVSPKAYENLRADSEPAEPIADNAAVVVAAEVIDGWKFLYRFITETEFVLCLEGTRQNGRIVVDGFRLAQMEATSVNSVRYQPCTSPRYVGTAHNHPPVGDTDRSLCYQSEPDRRSFGMDSRAVVDIVLCGDDKYRYWLKDGRTAQRDARSSETAR
jgi:hypothetical protein